MKFILATTPIRPVPTAYPPVASTSLLETLLSEGYDPFFYDIDALRPSFEEVVEFFRREQPDILGISSVVSTAYRYARDLSRAVRKVSPRTQIILGGNLAASAEILLRKCPIDVCVIGEGEVILLNLVRHFEKFGDFKSSTELKAIKGLAFLDENQNMQFTGYEAPINSGKMRQPNYELLEKFSDISRFITDPFKYDSFIQDPRSLEPHRKGKKVATVLTSKGCVARCTFCHRWDKGYRVYHVDQMGEFIQYLKEKYNVGFIRFGDENFGSDHSQVEEFVETMKPLDVLFELAGIRVWTVDKDPQIIRKLQDVGCSAMHFGMESGSPKMLSIMEKRASLEQNRNVTKLLAEANMNTIYQMVLGMPGENEETIQETIEFLKFATEILPVHPHQRLSLNYFQALPGTPGYEFMRDHGLIGKTLDDEEGYLLKISDVDASSFEHYMNVSESSMARARLWAQRAVREVTINYLKKRSWKALSETEAMKNAKVKDFARGGYFRLIKTSLRHSPRFLWMWDKFRWLLDPLDLFRGRMEEEGFKKAVLLTLKLAKEEDRTRFKIGEAKSLRNIVEQPKPELLPISALNMIPLRLGR